MNEKDDFKSYLLSKGLAELTIKNYLRYYGLFGSEDNFTQENVDNFIIVNGYHPSVKAFISNYRSYLIRRNPDKIRLNYIDIIRRTGRKKKKLVEFLEVEQIQQIEEALTSERNRLMLLVTFFCGLRVQGLLNLRTSDFNINRWLKDRTQPCRVKVTEKGEKQRIVLLPPEITQRLANWATTQEHIQEEDSYIWKMSSWNWQKILMKAGKSCGIPVHPHLLRHSCATWLRGKGWDLQELADYLGHDSISTTQIYSHVDKKEIQKKYAEIFKD